MLAGRGPGEPEGLALISIGGGVWAVRSSGGTSTGRGFAENEQVRRVGPILESTQSLVLLPGQEKRPLGVARGLLRSRMGPDPPAARNLGSAVGWVFKLDGTG